MEIEKVKAIWTPEQVDKLNKWQHSGQFHPFTCLNDSETLIATTHGWICPKCDYTQDWAWDFMAE